METRTTDRQTAKTLLDAEAIDRTLSRIAHELIERTENLEELAWYRRAAIAGVAAQ